VGYVIIPHIIFIKYFSQFQSLRGAVFCDVAIYSELKSIILTYCHTQQKTLSSQ